MSAAAFGPESDPQRDLLSALAAGELSGEAHRRAIRLLEQSESSRAAYRALTAERFPDVPNYTIVEQVGKGGFGVVYRAIHHAKQRCEALKVLFSRTPLLAAYFQNEVHLVARLQHPHIATLYEAQLATPPLYYTMEFVEGVRLNEHLRRHDVSLAERIGLVATVARAIGYAHAQGVVHRDLKPQNILIAADGSPHIVDFGIAKRLGLDEGAAGEADEGGGRRREGAIGTLGYIAPEQTAGKAVDARADVYALGALLFHCVTGEPARQARQSQRLLKRLRKRRITRPRDLAAIIARCVEPDPDRRYATCVELVADLGRYLAGDPVHARRASPVYRAARMSSLVLRRYPLPVRAVIVATVAVVMTAVYWMNEARATAGGTAPADQTRIIAFRPSTLEAIRAGRIGADLPGLNADRPKSFRMLHGRLMERLAVAEPRVIVWDYWAEDAQPEYDDAFVRGVQALRAPVVIGARRFDLNGRPALSETIRRAVSACGSIVSIKSEFAPGELEVVYCIERGNGSPIPSLPVAAYAAARRRGWEPVLELDAPRLELQVRYVRRRPAEGEPSLLKQADTIPLLRINELKAGGQPFGPSLARDDLRPGDRLGQGRVRIRPSAWWQARTVAYEDVLGAAPEQVDEWFRDRAVVIGNQIPGKDEHRLMNGERIFGCQVPAETLDALLSGSFLPRLSAGELAARVVLWCLLAGLAISLMPQRKARPVHFAGAACALLAPLGFAAALFAALFLKEGWQIEAAIALTSLVTAGSLTLWARTVSERPLQLALSADEQPERQSTVSSTLLAETTA